ncbi:3-hydroxybutyrate dehydrogenase [Plantactinospora sp. BB1]|uniref:3-hydroxybutyrate dehydrogenase n=1 Tax=Plantactinospora sp. BB1 TaxID=2071627 RepID=UPI000D153786|nr:3-hydroxybutyrate dehydrogenase [Plantactinospora sp. BB1]AVT40376.1 3-hydroxybutyrate dehydrogenase [Plantactinospora sp. BB1]
MTVEPGRDDQAARRRRQQVGSPASADDPPRAGRAAPPVVRLDLSGRTALVTGGASGIGRACAARLAEAGATVTVLDRDADRAEAVAAEIGGRALGLDLADPHATDRIDPELDIVVNNAGLQHVAPLHEFPPDRFDHLHRVMVTAPFLIVRRALPHMYAGNWGRIVNISSVHGLRASAFKSAYVSAKHALEGLSKVVALEGAAHGVTANCVNPAYVRTPLVEGQITAQASAHGIAETEVIEQIMLARAAIKRLIEPEEVAELVAYLCTPAASFLTGASIPLDGGWTAN